MKNTELSPIQQELLSSADTILKSISGVVDKATDIAVRELPDIAVQFIAFGRVYVTVCLLASVLFFIIGMYILYRGKVFSQPNITTSAFDAMLISIIPFAASIFILLLNFKDFALVWFAPKIWIMTEIVKLIK
jgi:hypothetical protein